MAARRIDRRIRPIVVAIPLLVVSAVIGRADDSPKPSDSRRPEARLTFEKDVVPILKAHCFQCHGEDVRKSGLDLRRRFALVAGGDSGPAIVPGKPDESLLLEMVADGLMPPEGETRPEARQVETIRQWIAEGAAIDGDQEAPLAPAETGREVTPEDREFWAFQPPTRPNVPRVQAGHRVRNPIDAFLLARLEEKEASFNPDASRQVLIRRLYFDLLGLPPMPEDIQQFLADDRLDAYEKLVDRLLDSPAYGERWGRHWLDIAGYADSDGYLEADRLRPEAWRYRDYVIRSLNADKPYDRFVLEQLAGDELVDWRRAEELTPEMADCLIATGFLRTAADPTYPGYAEKLECYKVMADTIEIVSSTFLGLTLQCARCHSHKFDPISQRDYYRMHAIFQASYDPQDWVVSIQRAIPLATEAQQQRVVQRNEQVEARVQQLNEDLARLTARYQDKLLKEALDVQVDESVRTQIKQALLTEADKRNDEQKALIAQYAPDVQLDDERLLSRFPEFETERQKLQAAISAEQALKQSIVQVRGLMDLDETPRQAHLLMRGDFNSPGKPVEPGFPAVLVPDSFEFQAKAGHKTTGRRRALAEWLVDPAHPLTARVHVNRMWAHHFGRGIVATPDDFGRMGEKPSHPQLLDWLATEFIQCGWSQKHMHRLMVTSTAYRQSSQPNSRQQEVDPQNLLLGAWRPQRHEGEVVRDTILAVTGQLDRQMLGTPVPVTRHGNGLVTVQDGREGHRRSIYLIVRRSQPVTLLELFDTPRMEVNCTQRTESIVVTQSLVMMNSQFLESSAKALADRILAEVPEDSANRLDHLFELVYGRQPHEEERRAVEQFLKAVAREKLGETASEEQRRQAETTGWTELALVLLNSNEFLFVH